MNQNERLDYLIEAFKEDSGEYNNLKVPVVVLMNTNNRRFFL